MLLKDWIGFVYAIQIATKCHKIYTRALCNLLPSTSPHTNAYVQNSQLKAMTNRFDTNIRHLYQSLRRQCLELTLVFFISTVRQDAAICRHRNSRSSLVSRSLAHFRSGSEMFHPSPLLFLRWTSCKPVILVLFSSLLNFIHNSLLISYE